MRPVILILGPTAGGKSQLAMDLAMTLPPSPPAAEIITCDSMQVYRGMDIGTAKPTFDDRTRVPHHLLDLIQPDDDSFSVDRWLDMTHHVIDDIRRRHRWPIIVGGTNLYVQAFLFGMMDGPPPNEPLRMELNALELPALRARLLAADPAAADRIHPNDRKRSIRAIEVFETTGTRLSCSQTQWQASATASGEAATRNATNDVITIGLDYPVEAINRRINARVKTMIEAGFVDEVKRLYESKSLGRNAREALGYKQIIEHLEGHCSLEEATEQMKIRTRRYAKQQRTWLRRFKSWPNSLWLPAAEMTVEQRAAAAVEFVDQTSASLPLRVLNP